ncbi:MAG: YeiH family protein [Cytophagales bacterium]|nr:YeiH family protein [Cytophagales bacterium]
MKSKLVTSEDYWAIWLGAFFLLTGIIIYIIIGQQSIGEEVKSNHKRLSQVLTEVPFHSVEYYKAKEKTAQLTGANTSIGKRIRKLLSKPKSWKGNPLNAFLKSEERHIQEKYRKLEILRGDLKILEEKARKSEQIAGSESFKNDLLNREAAVDAINWKAAYDNSKRLEKKINSKGYNVIISLFLFGLSIAAIFGLGAYFMGYQYRKFILAFWGVFILAVFSYTLAVQTDMKNLGISYAVWAILIGLIISNTIGTPAWLKPAIQTEYYIKTGLVLLGAEILLGKIMAIGLPGIFVSWVVTPVVLITTFWFGQRVLKIGSKTLNITISADMSVCGVSAAIATAAACNAKKEELTLAVGLSMVFTSIMMIVMPAFINAVGIPEILGGAWIGGTIDATGAVVAAGAFLGDKALNVAATIKMIQNVLIGIIAFGVAFYWASRVENTSKTKIRASEIWKRFPKFILGFLGASIMFSAFYALLSEELSYALIDHGVIRGFTKDLRGWLFCLAFVSIGLSVNFKELKNQFAGGKPLILYVCGQSFNLMLTLLMAYLMFYIVFPEITNLI